MKIKIRTIKKPKNVRFALDETAMPNLCNKEGLPAIPFRTGVSEKNNQ